MMDTITKSPDIAVFFGVLAVGTSVVLVFPTPRAVEYLFAVFWFITGLLALRVSSHGVDS